MASSTSQLTAACLPASQEVTECIMSKVHWAFNLQHRRVMGEESWWNNDCRWSRVRELAPKMTHWLSHPHKQKLWMGISRCHSSVFPCVCYRKCGVQFFSQVEVERRDRKRSLWFWPSCCPTVRAWNRSTGAYLSDAATHRHSFPLTRVEDRQKRGSMTATVTEQRLAWMVNCITTAQCATKKNTTTPIVEDKNVLHCNKV